MIWIFVHIKPVFISESLNKSENDGLTILRDYGGKI